MNIDKQTISNASDYLDKEKELCNSQLPIMHIIQTIDQHPFVKWIGKQCYFKEAKVRMDKSCVVIEDAGNPRVNEYSKHFALEGLFAFTIVSTKQAEKLLPQIVVHKTEQQAMITLLEKLHAFLTDGKIYFGNGVKQQILTALTGNLLENPGYSPFSSKKDHEFLLRHTFIKFFTQGLLRIYINVTDTLATDISLEIVANIFSPVDRSELQKFMKIIRPVLDDENQFLEKTIYDVYMNGLQ